jgi:hypothetical protein
MGDGVITKRWDAKAAGNSNRLEAISTAVMIDVRT